MKTASKQAGFSLVELMCAILILGIALVGLTQGVTTALRSNKEAEVQTAAALLAAAQIETLRAEGFITDGTTEGECDEPGLELYRWRETVSSTTVDGLHEVEVVVENSKSGQSIYELRTLLFEAPFDDSLSSKNSRKDKKNREGRQ
jgi:prepilin-type N-terminal cleavage/methylation domain-containing protein